MIKLKSNYEIEQMRKSGKLLANLFEYLEDVIKPDMTTKKLDELAYDFIKKHNAIPSFLGYGGFPATLCTSLNEVVVHGFPNKKKLVEGQILSVDAGLILNGWHSDAARTYLIGDVDPKLKDLVETTKQSFFAGVEKFCVGNRLGDISHAVQEYNESRGYSVVTQMVGHGIGRDMHEDPSVPNYGRAGHGIRLQKGLVLAIEPMVNMGESEVEILEDGWTCVTMDRMPSAHYENTVALTENGAEILTI